VFSGGVIGSTSAGGGDVSGAVEGGGCDAGSIGGLAEVVGGSNGGSDISTGCVGAAPVSARAAGEVSCCTSACVSGSKSGCGDSSVVFVEGVVAGGESTEPVVAGSTAVLAIGVVFASITAASEGVE
jgi:hypothetical protein